MEKRLVYFYQLQQQEVTVFHYVNICTCEDIRRSSLPKIKLGNFYISHTKLKFHYVNVDTCVNIKQCSLPKIRLVYFYQLQQQEVTVFHYENVDTCVDIKRPSLQINVTEFYSICNCLKLMKCFII